LRPAIPGTGNAPPGSMLKKLGQRILDLIDTIPLGWLDPARRPVAVPVRRIRRPGL